MKTKYLSLIILFALFVQCAKDKIDSSPVELTKGLLACFRFDDNMADSTGNVTNVGFSAAELDNAADRHGKAGLAKIFTGGYWIAQVTPNWPANPITVSFWIKRADNVSNKYFFTANSGAIAFVQNGAKIGFVVSTPTISTAFAETGNDWTHIAGTYDGENVCTYVNGKLVTKLNNPGSPELIGGIRLGLINGVSWHGSLDDMRYYSRVLSEKEIAVLAKQ